MKTYTVTIDGQAHEVQIERDGARCVATVAGRRIELDVVAIPPSSTHGVLVEGHSMRARLTGDGTDRLLETSRGTYAVRVEGDRDRLLSRLGGAAGAAAHGEVLKAPMPGLIVAVKVAVGDVVKPGTPLIVMEAMKMENELKCLRGGTVSEIHVANREAVPQGRPLVTLK